MQKFVTTVDSDGKEIELIVNKPTGSQKAESQIVLNTEWLKAEGKGCALRINLDDVAKRHGVWNDDIKLLVEKIEKNILDIEKKLRAGSKFFKTKLEARNAALKIKKLRSERLEILSKRSSLDDKTAESHAETMQRNYLISVCVVYSNSGKPYFIDLNDYLERIEEKATQDVSQAFLELLYSDILDYEKNYYENQFLLQHGFVDEKFRLINVDKQLIDIEGRLIDENGRFIKDGKFVDINGDEVDIKGNYVIEFVPFEE